MIDESPSMEPEDATFVGSVYKPGLDGTHEKLTDKDRRVEAGEEWA